MQDGILSISMPAPLGRDLSSVAELLPGLTIQPGPGKSELVLAVQPGHEKHAMIALAQLAMKWMGKSRFPDDSDLNVGCIAAIASSNLTPKELIAYGVRCTEVNARYGTKL